MMSYSSTKYCENYKVLQNTLWDYPRVLRNILWETLRLRGTRWHRLVKNIGEIQILGANVV